MKVSAVMTKEVLTVAPATPLRDVARLMVERAVSGVPVTENGSVLGVVSEADIVAKERGQEPERGGLLDLLLEDRSAGALKLEAKTAGEAMSSPAVTIGADLPVHEAAAKMIDERVNRLPVVDAEGSLVGIVTRADLVRAFIRSDEEIAEEIRDDVVVKTLWVPPEAVEVTVENGVCTLRGEVENRATALLLARLAQRVPGVVSVTSSVTWEDQG